jgi:hypothetical protein
VAQIFVWGTLQKRFENQCSYFAGLSAMSAFCLRTHLARPFKSGNCAQARAGRTVETREI